MYELSPDLVQHNPRAYHDQDALNAMLMSELPAEALAPIDGERVAASAEMPRVRCVDPATLDCRLGQHRTLILHYITSPKPWQRSGWITTSNDAYVRLLARLLGAGDVPVSINDGELPVWLRGGDGVRRAALIAGFRSVRAISHAFPAPVRRRVRTFLSGIWPDDPARCRVVRVAPVRVRLLVLTSFAPSFDAPHGGRVLTSLLARLAERHDMALVCFRNDSDPPVDDVLLERCLLVEEVAPPQSSSSVLRQRATRLLKLVGAPPDRVARVASPAYADCVRAAAASFQPQVIQVLFAEMAQYVGAIAGVRAPCVLIDQDPGVRAAADYSHSATGLRRLSRHIDTIAWERYSRRVFSDFDRIVVLTDSDRESVAPLAGGVGIEKIPLAVELPARPSIRWVHVRPRFSSSATISTRPMPTLPFA